MASLFVPAAVAPLRVRFDGTYASWRSHARALAMASMPPSAVVFVDPRSMDDLFAVEAPDTRVARQTSDASFRVPKSFLNVAEAAAHHRASTRWGLLYRVVYRITHGEPDLMENAVDQDVHALNVLAKEVRRDAHKMEAFVRFKRLTVADGDDTYVAWHRPDHFIVPYVTPFFVERFGAMHWTILTPEQSVTWDGNAVAFGPGVPRSHAPQDDELEGLWKTYYASIFNPARLKLKAMHAEMPRKHWATLPEAVLIPDLVRGALARSSQMVTQAHTNAAVSPPPTQSLEDLREAATQNMGAQTVFGRGNPKATLVLVGEQPGDEEDKRGEPFVGPAGQVLDRALAEAGIDREAIYLTNAVKHFKWRASGKRRLHQKPDGGDIEIWKPWLLAELTAIRPRVVVALGATASQSLLGRKVTIQRERGRSQASPHVESLRISYHPSAILRAPDDATRDALFAMLVEDLRAAKAASGV